MTRPTTSRSSTRSATSRVGAWSTTSTSASSTSARATAGCRSGAFTPLDDPQGFTPDALTRVDYRTKGPGWLPVFGAIGELPNGNNWQDTATEQWIRGELEQAGGGVGLWQLFYSNTPNTNPDSIQPYLTNVPLWLDDGNAPDFDFTALDYQVLPAASTRSRPRSIPGDSDRDGDVDQDDIDRIASRFGDERLQSLANGSASAAEGVSADPADADPAVGRQHHRRPRHRSERPPVGPELPGRRDGSDHRSDLRFADPRRGRRRAGQRAWRHREPDREQHHVVRPPVERGCSSTTPSTSSCRVRSSPVPTATPARRTASNSSSTTSCSTPRACSWWRRSRRSARSRPRARASSRRPPRRDEHQRLHDQLHRRSRGGGGDVPRPAAGGRSRHDRRLHRAGQQAGVPRECAARRQDRPHRRERQPGRDDVSGRVRGERGVVAGSRRRADPVRERLRRHRRLRADPRRRRLPGPRRHRDAVDRGRPAGRGPRCSSSALGDNAAALSPTCALQINPLFPTPPIVLLPLFGSGAGGGFLTLPGLGIPGTTPAGLTVYLQVLYADAGGVAGNRRHPTRSSSSSVPDPFPFPKGSGERSPSHPRR